MPGLNEVTEKNYVKVNAHRISYAIAAPRESATYFVEYLSSVVRTAPMRCVIVSVLITDRFLLHRTGQTLESVDVYRRRNYYGVRYL